MKLFYSPGACSLAPHIILEEIGKPYEIELVSTMDGSTHSNEYLKINPKGRVPVLSVDGETITEVSAILTYLALLNPHRNFLLNTPIGLTRTIEWMNWLAGIHTFIVAQNWRTERFTDDVKAHQGIQKKGMENLRDVCSQINAKLMGIDWAVENTYSIVDTYLLVFYRWGNRLGLKMREFKNWTKHTEQMAQRAAVKSVLNTENISIWN